MNAFALHDVSDQASVRRWGASATAIVVAHAALIALALNWYTQRPVPGVSLPAIMVDMAPVSSAPQPTQVDLAPGPVMQQADASPPEPAAAEAVQEADRADAAAGEAGSRRPAGAEDRADAAEAGAGQGRAREKAVAGKAESGSRGREEADRRAACAANDGLAQGRAPGAGRVRRQRRRIGGGPCLLPADGRRRICNASSNTRPPPSPRASRAPRGSASRSAEAVRCFPSASAARQAIRRWMPRRWRWCAAPSRFPHSRRM